MKTYLVIRPHGGDVVSGHVVSEHDLVQDARRSAATKAGIGNLPHYVVQVLGVQQPVYDPEVGWATRVGDRDEVIRADEGR